MAKHADWDIGRLFIGGMITAAGAGLFWLIAGAVKRHYVKGTYEEATEDDFDRILVASEAAALEE